MFLVWAGQVDRAVVEAEKALEIDATQPIVHQVLAECFLSRGLLDQARDAAEISIGLAPLPLCVATLVEILVLVGEQERLAELLAQWKDNPAVMCRYHLARGDIEAAADCYEAAIDQRSLFALMMAGTAPLKSLCESHRWPALARKMNLA
jgi:tetratricopeptide (TPR) repeat protein